MVSEAQGENSSSRNVKLELTDIRRGADGRAAECGFSDGSSFFMHSEAVIEYNLHPGDELERQLLEEILLRSAEFTARDKAVEYIARREHSGQELVLKLMKKGYDRQTASAAVDMLRERGYVDDRRFAGLWIESRFKKHPEGRGSLLAGLAKKGVPREVAAEAVENFLSDEQLDDALSRCMEKYIRTHSTDPRKVVNHLLRRGFRYGDIKRHMAGLDEFAEETGMEYNEYD